MITNYNKLVRDRIPDIIEAKGKRAVFSKLNDQQYKQMLNLKLQEELDEYTSAQEEDQVEELVDLVELVYVVWGVKAYPSKNLKRSGERRKRNAEALKIDCF